jgi:hypothetical protein
MSKFEELIKEIKDGNMDAVNQLEAEFSGSALREKAEKAGELQAQVESLAPFAKEAKIKELQSNLPDKYTDVQLSADDLKDVGPSDITLETLIVKAEIKQQAQQKFVEQAATAAGFESVEAYQSALDSVRPEPSVQQPEALSNMEIVASAVTNTATGNPEQTTNTRDLAQETYKDSKSSGKAHDYAMGEALEALFDNQINQER